MKFVRSECPCGELFTLDLWKGDMILHFPTSLFPPETAVPADFWIMSQPGTLGIASREKDLPSWFILRPTEREGDTEVNSSMQALLSLSYEEPVVTLNSWRVKTGDRIVLVMARPWLDKGVDCWLLDMQANALVYWTRPDGSVPLGVDGGGSEPQEHPSAADWLRAASAYVSRQGPPREIEFDWKMPP